MRRYIVALLGAIAIGSVGMWINLIDGAVPIMTVNFLRVFLAAVLLAVIGGIFGKGIFKLNKKEASYYLILGLLIGTAMSMFNTAFLYLTIPQVYILDALFPFFVLVLGGHFLKDGIRASDIIALILGAIAIAVLNPMGFQTQAGVSLIFVEVVLYALMLVYMRKQGAEYTFKSTFWMFLFASLFLAPFPVIYGFGSLSTSWHWVALLGFGTGLGYICFNYALMRIKSQTMNIMLILGTTIFGFLTAVLVFKEVLATKFLIGSGLLLFAGVFLKYMRGFGKGRLAKIVYYAGSKKAKLLQRE